MDLNTLTDMPPWMSVREDGMVELDPDIFYPTYLAELGVLDKDIDQYWLEVCYQMVKLDAQAYMVGTVLDTNRTGEEGVGKMPRIKITGGSGDRPKRWALKNYPEGKGVLVATKGMDARKIYISRRKGHPWIDLVPGEEWYSHFKDPDTKPEVGPFPRAV